ncbi:MAG TPA: hypothetical protein VF298_01740 [Bacteroidales bacterium]
MKRIRHISNQSNPAVNHRFNLHDENVPRTDPFQVPENYFDELPQKIMDWIAADTQKKQENPQPSPILRRVWMSAAAVAAIAVFFMIIKPANIVTISKSPIAKSTKTASLSDEYDQTYADEALLLEENGITDKDVSTIDFNTMGIALSSNDTTSATTEEIIQYLLDENDDTDLLAGL